MVVIRLSRVGKKNSPAYRVVVAEKRRAVKRKFIEIIGHYNPTLNPKELKIDADRANFWMNQGAQPSSTVRNLMVDLEILKKDQKVNIKYAKDKKKKELKEEKEGKDNTNTKTPAETPVEKAPADKKAEEKEETPTEKEELKEDDDKVESLNTTEKSEFEASTKNTEKERVEVDEKPTEKEEEKAEPKDKKE